MSASTLLRPGTCCKFPEFIGNSRGKYLEIKYQRVPIPIARFNRPKYLGVYFSENTMWNAQIEHILAKLRFPVIMLARLKNVQLLRLIL